MAENVLKFKPTAQTMLNVAQDYIDAANYSMAVDCLYRAHLKNKKDCEIMIKLGETYCQIRDYPQSIVWFLRALNANAKNDRVYAGLMQSYIDWGYGMSSAPFYYYTLGVKNGAFKTEDIMNGVYDDDLIAPDYDEEEDFPVKSSKSRLKYANLRLSNSMKYEAGKTFYEQEEYNAAYKALKDIPETSVRYIDAQRILMKIDVFRGHAKSATERAETILKQCPNDCAALINGAIAYGEKYELKKRDELFERFVAENDADADEAKKGAAVAISLKRYDVAVKYCNILKKTNPYSRSILLKLALLHANVGNKAKAKNSIIEAYRLYPDDLALKYYAQKIEEMKEAADFEITDGVPEEEAKRREDILDKWLLEKATIGAVTAGLKADATMSEYLDWLFAEGDLDFQGDVAIFLAQSSKWKKYLETLLINPNVNSGLKKDILISMFDNFYDCKVAVTTGQIYQKIYYNPPVGLCPLADKTYRAAFVNLAFISDGYVRNLNKALSALNPALDLLSKQETEPDVQALAAVITYRCGIIAGSFKKKECLRLFECSEENFNRYLKSLDISGIEFNKRSKTQ